MPFGAANQRSVANANLLDRNPVGLMDGFRSARRLAEDTMRTQSISNLRSELLTSYRRDLEGRTGESLPDPNIVGPRRLRGSATGPQGQAGASEFWKRAQELTAADPNLPSKTMDDINSEILQRQEALAQEVGEEALAPHNLWYTAGQIAGGITGLSSDPLVLMSMTVGAPAATTLLKAVAVEAGIGAATEAAIQAVIQQQRVSRGGEVDLGQAAEAVALGAAGGAVFGAVLRGAVPAARVLVEQTKKLSSRFHTPEVQAAWRTLDQLDAAREISPFGTGPIAHAEHFRRMDEAMVRLQGEVYQNRYVSTTAVGRVMAAQEPTPVRATRVTEEFHGEPVEQFNARFRKEQPELAKESDRLGKAIVKVDDDLQRIESQLQDAERLAHLQSELKGTTDKRKIRSVKRRIDRHLSGRKEFDAKRKLAKLNKERPTARARKRTLETENTSHQRKVDLAMRRQVPETRKGLRVEMEQGIGGDVPLHRARVGQFLDNVRRVANSAQRNTDNIAQEPSAPVPERQLFTEQELRQQAEIARDPSASDVALEALISDEDGFQLELPDAQGNLKLRNIEEALEDFKADQKTLQQFEACIRGSI